MDYTSKRNREAYHGGIDMPAPFGTPIRAAAAGTVVGVYNGKGHRGIQLILRHTPEDTGIPLYVYTVYAHFQKMPHFSVGDRVRMGQVLGPTGNTGRTRAHRPEGRPDGQPRGGQSGRAGVAAGLHTSGVRRGDGHGQRRPAIHFAVYYSASPKYASLGGIVVPQNGYWMDSVALFRANPPFDSAAMRALPASAKRVPIPYLQADGRVHPEGSKLVWPYACGR